MESNTLESSLEVQVWPPEFSKTGGHKRGKNEIKYEWVISKGRHNVYSLENLNSKSSWKRKGSIEEIIKDKNPKERNKDRRKGKRKERKKRKKKSKPEKEKREKGKNRRQK